MTTKIKSIDPRNEEVIGTITSSSKDDVLNKISLAKKAFPAWNNNSIEKRAILLKSFLSLLERNKENLTELLKKEIGKTDKDAGIEFFNTKMAIEYYLKKRKQIKKDINFNDLSYSNSDSFVKFVSHGVIGIITPWNFPLSLPMWSIIPALLTGNAVILKPSEYSSLITKKIDQIANNVFPKGVFNVIYGDSKVGEFLVESNVDKIFFTGGIESGKKVLNNIGIKPISLELGGKDSAVVCEDADINLAAKGIVWGSINNNGEVCSSIEKVYVHKGIADKITSKIIDEVKKLKEDIDFGPLINNKQRLKVEEHVNDAIKNGAKILIGGEKIGKKGYFYSPTVLVDLKEDMKIMKEETFGPIIPISVVKEEDEAIELINKSKYGLGVSIWTKNLKNGQKLADKINVGMVWINDVGLPLPGADYWGGTKNSGLRSTESKLMQCLKAKTFILNKGESREWWYNK